VTWYIVVHQDIGVSDIIASDILDSDWERFQSLASEVISHRIEINSGIEANKAAHDFTASIASAHRLSTSKVTLSNINNDLPGLD
jgi:hypothetical protein